jgi:hypothetical protein
MMIILRVERAVNLSKAERRLVRGSGGGSRRISTVATSIPLWDTKAPYSLRKASKNGW